ncbi:hypothetical protein HY734_01885 [Candidatus Uhrbacteria bacterium]|nr:hypothetical protein [Candidatus Uhrbacteria bacterium]
MAIESKMRRPLFPSLGEGTEAAPKKKRPWLVPLIVILVAVAAGGGYAWFRKGVEGDILTALSDERQAGARDEPFQAVFLDNGQVYFGTLSERSEDFYRLSNIYYLRFRQNPQLGDAVPQTDADFSLVKLGNEVHGPEDFMDISKDHILFIEDLKADSKVTQAISDYLNKKSP